MIEERIRLNSTNSNKSVNTKEYVDLEINQHTKVFPFPSVIDDLSQRQVFEEERRNCNDYRLILTINPYCSNILFNVVSEIVQNEGSDKTDKNKNPLVHIMDCINGESFKSSELGEDYTIKGKIVNMTSYDMVRNTEYANGSKPFVYHCGLDIFNNHIIRNNSFKLINPLPKKIIQEEKNVFNTIEDLMRDASGNHIPLSKRTDIGDYDSNIQTLRNKHLYDIDDIDTFKDCINNKLREENGWYGFYNTSSITTKQWNGEEWVDMKTSRVFNNQESVGCDFVELYPDSTLFSFNPKYNSFLNREEQNWDICITYPYKNDYGYDNDNSLICGKLSKTDVVNGLKLLSVTRERGSYGQDIILFRSYVKHNLESGDVIKLYYKEKNKGFETEIDGETFTVLNVGDLKGNNKDYYFYINYSEDITFENNKDIKFEDIQYYRFVKFTDDIERKYYYRKFRKLPNFKYKKEEYVKGDDLEKYITENAKYGPKNEKKMYLFDKEQYPLGFAKTIYGDDVTQVTFTDSLNIENLTDNLGRPLTELFVTIIKRNKGHEKWYIKDKNEKKIDLKEIEYSHCFGKVKSGLIIHGEEKDSKETKDLRKQINDVTLLTNVEWTETNGDITLKELDENKDSGLDKDITLENDEFYGDLVELDIHKMKETVLSDVCFRFNTEQREHIKTDNDIDCFTLKYDEITKDDYDYINNPSNDKGAFEIETKTDINERIRPEGYYYKAHYGFKVRTFGKLNQSSHRKIAIRNCRLIQSDGLFIEVTAKNNSGADTNNYVFLHDTYTGERIASLHVFHVENSVRFQLVPMSPTDDNYVNAFNIANGLLFSRRSVKMGETWQDKNGLIQYAEEDMDVVDDYSQPKYTLYSQNIEIPDYAYDLGDNNYIWREILNIGDINANDIEEYPFMNGNFYVNKDINFYLKRQDPYGYNGLWIQSHEFDDLYGNEKKTESAEYKDITENVC